MGSEMCIRDSHRADIHKEILSKQTMTSVLLAVRLTRLLRLSVILSMRRRHEVLPEVQITAQAEALTLTLPEGWLDHHPLMRAELEQEMLYQQQAGWQLAIE